MNKKYKVSFTTIAIILLIIYFQICLLYPVLCDIKGASDKNESVERSDTLPDSPIKQLRPGSSGRLYVLLENGEIWEKWVVGATWEKVN